MALFARPSSTPSAPEVPLHPAPALQAFPAALPPRPSPQLLSAPMIGAQPPPSAYTPFTALHAPPPLGGQPLGLVRAQHFSAPLPGTVPLQQLLLLQSPQLTAQQHAYPYPVHQHVPSLAYIAPPTAPTAPLQGYAGHHVTPLGDAMVIPEEHLDATQ